MRKLSVLCISLLSMILFSQSCAKKNSEVQDLLPESQQNQAKVLDDIQYKLISANEGYYTYEVINGQIDEIQNGSFLVHHEFPAKHEIRKIVYTEKVDSKTIKVGTLPAALEEILPDTKSTLVPSEAFQVCEYTKDYVIKEDGTTQIIYQTISKVSDEDLKKITAGNFKTMRASLQGTMNLNFPISIPSKTLYSDANNYLNVTYNGGTVNINPSVTVKLETSWAKLQYFEVIGNATIDFNTSITATASKQLSKSFDKMIVPEVHKVFLFFIGVVPVWFDLSAKLKANVLVSADATASAKLTLSGKYAYSKKISWKKDQGWESSSNGLETIEPTGIKPEWTLKGDLNAYAGLKGEVSLKLYNVVGPTLTAEPYFEGKASLDQTLITWDLSAGLNVDFKIGVNEENNPFQLFGINLLWEKNLITWKKTLLQGSYQIGSN